MKVRVSKKQQEEINVVREFAALGYSSDPPKNVLIEEQASGLTPEQAYVAITVHGRKSVVTQNRAEVCRLLWGQRWLNWQIAEYRKDLRDGLIDVLEIACWYAKRPQAFGYIARSLGF